MRFQKSMPFVLFTAMFTIGCQRATVPVPTASNPTVSINAVPTPDLATRLKSLSTDERKSLRQLLAEPVSTSSGYDARLVEIARELCHLTLTEANELGSQLDADQAGAVSEFALVPLQRQTWALGQVEQFKARVAKKIFPWELAQVWTCIVAFTDRDLPWLKARTGDKIKEVTGLCLACETDDMGPLPTGISDDDLKVVAAFTGLQSLDLTESQISDVGLTHLVGLRQLRFLDLRNTAVTDVGLRTVAELPSLSELRLENTKIAGPGIEHLAKCSNLSKLNFTANTDKPLDLRHFTRLESLEELQIIAHGDLDLHDLPNLVKLGISQGGSNDNPSGLRLANMPALENVSLTLHQSSPDRFQNIKIENLPEILQLYISADFAELPFDQIGQLTNVRELMIVNGPGTCSKADARHLANLSHLTQLFLGMNLDPGCLQQLRNLTALRQLAFGGGGSDDAELLHLKDLKLVERLSVWELHGTGQGFEVLQQMPMLQELKVTKSDLDALRLTGLPSVLRLHFDQCRIRSLDLTELPNLQTVNINRLKTDSISVKDLPKMRWLSLSLVNADRIKQVALHGLPVLETLQLVPITFEGAIEGIPYTAPFDDRLLADVATFSKLESLSIRSSAITDAGLQQLVTGPKIRWLEITGPNITEPAMQKLREALGSW